MNDDIFEVLEPVDGELYFSWIIRMLKFYSPNDSLYSYVKVGRKLFGNEFKLPNIIFPEYADAVVKKCNLKESKYLSSFTSVVNTMTILPFYMEVCTGSVSSLDSCGQYRKYFIDNKISYYDHFDQYNGVKLCFCPECIKENEGIILYREQQVRGNSLCWKHQCPLLYMNYKKTNHPFMKDIFNCYFFESANTIRFDEDMMETAKGISKVIHDIFIEGLGEELDCVCSKLTQKLFFDNNDALNNQYSFDDYYNKYFNSFDTNVFESIELKIKCRQIYKELFYRRNGDTICFDEPVILALLIYKAFGSLKNMHSYKLRGLLPKAKRKREDHYLRFVLDSIDLKSFSDYDFLGTYYSRLVIRNKTTNQVHKIRRKELSNNMLYVTELKM